MHVRSAVSKNIWCTYNKMRTAQGLWYVLHEWVASWFAQKPTIRLLEPRETIHSPLVIKKKVQFFREPKHSGEIFDRSLSLQPESHPRDQGTVAQSIAVNRVHHFAD